MKRLFLIAVFALLPYVKGVFACPFDTGWIEFTQPDSTKFIGRMYGDEYEWTFITEEGYIFDYNFDDGYYYYASGVANGQYVLTSLKVGIDKPVGIPKNISVKKEEAPPVYRPESEALPEATPQAALKDRYTLKALEATPQALTGTYTLKVLLVEFSDVKHHDYPTPYTKADFENMLSGIDYKRSPDDRNVYGSMNEYYEAMSNGQFHIQATVINKLNNDGTIRWISLPQNKLYYNTNGFRGPAMQAAQDSGLDISTRSGVKLAIIYAGNVYYSGELHPCAFDGGGGSGGVCSGYIMAEEYYKPSTQKGSWGEDPKAIFSNIGTHCHEFGHCLGFEDLYDKGIPTKYWCLMGNGWAIYDQACPAPINPYFRKSRGWISVKPLKAVNCGISFSYNERTPEVYEASIDGVQYYVENRQFRDFSIGLNVASWNYSEKGPGGILLWRKDSNGTYIIRADGINVYDGSQDDYGDVFPGATHNSNITDFTEPNCRKPNGNLSRFALCNVSQPGDVMTADVYTNCYGGPISGVVKWAKSKGPYVLTNDVHIPQGSTLAIQPGTEIVSVLGNYSIIQDGGIKTDACWEGPIISNMTWNQSPYYLAGNVTIQSGATLTIESGINVNLGDYFIKAVNGNIIRKNSVMFFPQDVSVKNGSNVIGQYSKIAQANSNETGQSIYGSAINETIVIPTTSDKLYINNSIILINNSFFRISDSNPNQLLELSGNIIVESGSTFELALPTSLIGDSYIQSNGGTIKIEKIISPDIKCIDNGGNLKGQYATISKALENAVSGQTVDVAVGTYTIDKTVTVGSGVTLKIASGSTINFSADAKIFLQCNSSLIDAGVTYNPVRRIEDICQSITVVSPAEGTVWNVGEQHRIQWTNTNFSGNVKIEYTIVGGEPFIAPPIAENIANTGFYNWTIPNTPSNKCKIRVSDAVDNNPVGESGLFTILGSESSIVVTNPKGGECWDIGSVHDIEWSCQNFSGDVKIDYSTNGGNDWMLIVATTSNTGKYSWTVPNVVSSNCYIRVSDAADGNPSDKNDQAFSIDYPKKITVIYPNGGEIWAISSEKTIKWTKYRISGNVKIEYSTNNGSSWSLIASDVSDSTFIWIIPNTPSKTCLVRISDVSNTSVYDISDKVFEIYDSTPIITVTSPKRGDRLKAGQDYLIQWTCQNYSGSKVMIDYSYDNTYTPKEIKYGAPNTGSYVWTVPEENSTLCQVRVWDPEDWYPWGNSAIFTIYPKEITVLSPDGGEVWTVGTQHDIKWSKYQFNNNVKIEYSIDNGSSWTLVAENIADITYTWTIPDTPSKNCLVRVSDVSNSAIYDLTDKVFEIYYPLPRLTLTSPQAGDSLMTGRNYHILWTSENFTGKVKIEYSANNGINWTTVIDSTENDGLYTWTAPLSPSSHSVLRISSAKTGNPSNTSGVFIVYTPPETFVGGTLSQNTAWKENIRLTSDVIVPSSVTLTISPRTYVNMNGYALKSTGGVITKDSTSIFAPDISVTDWRGNLKGHYSSIQSAINNAVEKQVVRLGTGTFNEDVVLKNGVHLFGKSQSSTIINGKLDYTEGTKATYIHDLTILKPITIISAYDLAFRNVTSKTSFAMFDVVCLFEFVTVENTSGDAVLTWRSSNYNFGFRTLGSGNCAIRATKRSGLVFQDGHVTNLSQAFLILTSTAEIKNSFFCQNTYDLTAYWEATINSLSGNTYSGDASRVFRKDAVSSIIWEYFWKCGLGKASHSLSKSSDEGKENSVPMVSTSDPGMGEYWEAKNQLNFIHENKRRDSELRRSPDQKKYRNEYLDALSKFKTIVEKYPDSLCARLAVHEIGRTCLSMEEPEAGFNYLNTLLKSSKSKKLVFEVMDALVPYYVYTQEYNKALDLLEKLKKDHSKTQPEWEIDFEKGLIYKYHLKDSRKAIEMFKKVIDQCTDESFLSWVKLQLEELGVSELAKKNGPSEETGMGLTIQNVPNPFNPETEIHYRIPESGKVILKIYDILGREVRTLVNEEQNTGSHVALWDGKDEEGRQVSSGTYFYHLRFKDHHITGKMLLMR